MKISYNWLKDHIPLELSGQELAKRLQKLGFEVSSRQRRGPGFAGVVAAEILAIEKHPNADRLSLCTVTDGRERLSIVCGAANIAVGQKVPLARVGAVLPGGRAIGRASIRGVESQGMICSAEELGLGAQKSDGILVMDPGTEVGTDLAGKLGQADEILDVEITPNRPDCLSHLGLARELSACFRLPLKAPPEPRLPAPEGACLRVAVEEPEACPLYVGRVLTGLAVGPSPGWLAARLEAVGLRAINNLVDATNYILLDMGQPLHAFDLDQLEGGQIVVRYAEAGERLLALDNRNYELSPECLVIADANKPVALAGVMGGLESSVTGKTTRCFLESAHFFPPAVRLTSQSLRLRSESSYRFERGTDPAAVEAASARAAELILGLCGTNAKATEPVQTGPGRPRPAPILVTAERINGILGSSFPEEEIRGALGAIASLSSEGEGLGLHPPSYRSDLATPWDLAEEAGRLLGYENIPSRQARIPLEPSQILRSQALAERCRDRLAALGLSEAYNYDFVSERLLKLSRIETPFLVRVANPLSEDWAALRPNLLIGLLKNAATNANRGAPSLRLFEIGKAYRRGATGVEENRRVSGVLFGPVAEATWRSRARESDLYDAKGLVADLLCGLPGISWAPLREGPPDPGDPLLLPAASLRLRSSKGSLGAVGVLHPQAARAWELERQGVILFDLDLDLLAGSEPLQRRYRPYSPYPFVRRDLSVLVSRGSSYGKVERAVRACGIEELRSLELVDVFSGKGIPPGKRSLTLRLLFGREDRTLRDEEVNAAVEKVLSELKGLGAVLRA